MIATEIGIVVEASRSGSVECARYRPATTTHLQRFTVAYEFPVIFTAGLLDPPNGVLADTLSLLEPHRRHRCVVLIDEGVRAVMPGIEDDLRRYAHVHAATIDVVAPPLVLPGGEISKTDPALPEYVHRLIVENHIDRQSFIIAIGGGAMLDMVGFVAATAHRGVRLVRVPTTVLGQNDSGVGVKNAVNLFDQKNYLGTFAPPFAVLNDFDFIDVLPRRERIAGTAEAVKVALIRDAAFFTFLEESADALARLDRDATAAMIRRCAMLHMHQIAHGGDPFEAGSARPLDFGHWAAHRLETLTQHDLRHGEAVAIGIAIDTRYSVLAGLLRAGDADRVFALLDRLGLPTWHPILDRSLKGGDHPLLRGIDDFREHLGGELTVTLLSALGTGVEVHQIDRSLVLRSMEWLCQREVR